MITASILARGSDRHNHFFAVLQRFCINRQWSEDWTIVEGGSLNDVIREIAHLDGPMRVVEIDIAARTATDISLVAARDIAQMIRAGDLHPSRDLINFVEDCHGVGTLLPAMA